MHKEKKGRGHRLIVLLLLSVIVLLSAIACGLSLRLYRRSDPKLAGRWQMELDMTDSACARANAWLQAARLGSLVDVGAYMPPLRVYVELRLNTDGSWSRSPDTASLTAAEKQAETALHNALRELLRLRIENAGRPVEADAKLEKRLEDAAGLPLDRYFAEYGPALLPDADTLRARYEGGGSFQIEGVHIRFEGQDDARYLADDAILVLEYADRTEVYRRA